MMDDPSTRLRTLGSNIVDLMPSPRLLRELHPNLKYSLRGKFKNEIRHYPPNGESIITTGASVVSVPLNQGLGAYDPTIGHVPQGICRFPTGSNTETMLVLDGRKNLEARVEKDGKIVKDAIDSHKGYLRIKAKHGTELVLEVQDTGFLYLCSYKKTGK